MKETKTSISSPQAVWIDTDPSLGIPLHDADDAFALAVAFRSPELMIEGLSVTYGNTNVRRAGQIVEDLLSRLPLDHSYRKLRVYPGASGPHDFNRYTAATEALAEYLRRGEQRVTYLALGPLTNLATFLCHYPELASRFEKVIFVGGRTPGKRLRFGRGLPYEFHDANFEKDPKSTGMVLRAEIPLYLIPVELSPYVAIGVELFEKLKHSKSDVSVHIHRKARLWHFLWRMCFLLEGGPVFDVPAILAAACPECLEFKKSYACLTSDIEGHRIVGDRESAGFFLVDDRFENISGRPVFMCRGVAPSAQVLVEKRLG